MRYPISTNSILTLLAIDAYAKILPAHFSDEISSSWCGMELLALSIDDNYRDRKPCEWTANWPVLARSGLFRSKSSEVFKRMEESRELTPIEKIVESLVESGENLSEDFVDEGLFVKPIVIDDVFVRRDVIASLERAKESGLEVWGVVSGDVLTKWNEDHWSEMNKLGVSLLFVPNGLVWAKYSIEMERVSRIWARLTENEQWAWPICEMIGKGMQETFSLKKVGSTNSVWTKKVCKGSDWRKLRCSVWSSVQERLGGDNAIEELMIGSVLMKKNLLF